MAATAKHFCAYGPVTGGRDYASVDISERTLREVHLPAFAAAVRAGAAAIMPAFTDLAGIPMTAHKALLRDYLRGELGFDGVLVSDYNAIRELIHHGVAADIVEAAVLALKAGVDIDMMAEAYRKGLPVALERGLVTMDEIDECVLRVLRLKERLGLFDDPYRRGSSAEAAETVAARRRLARDVAAKSLVLVKNSADTLPLREGARRVVRDRTAGRRVARNARSVGGRGLRRAERHRARRPARSAAERERRARRRRHDLRRRSLRASPRPSTSWRAARMSSCSASAKRPR